MKYIVLFLISCLLVGCEIGKRKCAPTNFEDAEDAHCSIKTLTVRGIKHEYLFYHIGSYDEGGMTHLPNCKYCKTN